MSAGESVLGQLSTRPMVEPSARFEEVFSLTYPRLFGLTYRLLGDAMETEDTLQEAYLRLANTTVLHRPDEEVSAWLRRVCLNLAANRVRDRKRAQTRLERAGQMGGVEQDTGQHDPASVALRIEAQAEVRRALALLSAQHRDCLLLRHSGYSYAEIAATMGVAIGSVGVLLARAEKAFRDVYQEQGHGTKRTLP